MSIPAQLTCIECPLSCTLDLSEINGKIEVTGNRCRRGEKYAVNEALHPCRVLTTTVVTTDERCPRLPVRTAGEIPRELLIKAMQEINLLVIDRHVKPGDVLLDNLLGTGVDLVATGEAGGRNGNR